jgi:hypothetical protein
VITFTIPTRTPSTANLRESWQARHRRAKKQKTDARLCCPTWNEGPLLSVTLTRVGPKLLDVDNLASALKAIQDGIASWLRVDDGSPLVAWEYAQEKGEPSIHVQIFRSGELSD